MGARWRASSGRRKSPLRAESFQRYDESPDSLFYQDPRFVTHIDDKAIGALRGYYEEIFPGPGPNEDVAVLDLCSSWISHFPKNFKAGRVSGLGMNAEELRQRGPDRVRSAGL